MMVGKACKLGKCPLWQGNRSPAHGISPLPTWQSNSILDPEAGTAGEEARRAQHLAATGNPAPVLPFGVTLIGPAWSDDALWEVAAAFHANTGLGCGPEGHGVQPYRRKASSQLS